MAHDLIQLYLMQVFQSILMTKLEFELHSNLSFFFRIRNSLFKKGNARSERERDFMTILGKREMKTRENIHSVI